VEEEGRRKGVWIIDYFLPFYRHIYFPKLTNGTEKYNPTQQHHVFRQK